MEVARLSISSNGLIVPVLMFHTKSLDEDIVKKDFSKALTSVVSHMIKQMAGQFIGASDWGDFAIEYMEKNLGYIQIDCIDITIKGQGIISNKTNNSDLLKFINQTLIDKIDQHNVYCKNTAPSLDKFDFNKFKLKEDEDI